jgi:serine/threonine protein kinase
MRKKNIVVYHGLKCKSFKGLLPWPTAGSSGMILSRTGNHCTSYVATATYMTPERFDQEAHGEHYDPYAANMWSLGVTVLEVLMVRYPLLPFGQRLNWAALMCAICFSESPSVPDGAASPELQSFGAACLQKGAHRGASCPPVRRREGDEVEERAPGACQRGRQPHG